MRDPFEVLGVERGASHVEIKAAYHRLIKENHPDLHPGDKAAEDRMKEINVAYDVIKTGRQIPTFTANPYRPQPGPRPYTGVVGENFTAFVDVSLEECLRGCYRQVLYDRDRGPEVMLVKVPPGVCDGDKIVTRGAGFFPQRGFGIPGDLVVVIRVRLHARFKQGELGRGTLTTDAWLSDDELRMGWYVDVFSLEGTTIRIRVPPGTEPGRLLRVRERGLPVNGGRADLFVRIRRRETV